MRYLKLFDAKKEDTFFDITEAEYVTEHDSLDFTEMEKIKIESLIKINDNGRFRSPISIEYPFTSFTPERLAKINCRIIVNYEALTRNRYKEFRRTLFPSSHISIIKDDDEWFYVRDFYQETSDGLRHKEDIDYYKCDQLDGLLDCIDACINK